MTGSDKTSNTSLPKQNALAAALANTDQIVDKLLISGDSKQAGTH